MEYYNTLKTPGGYVGYIWSKNGIKKIILPKKTKNLVENQILSSIKENKQKCRLPTFEEKIVKYLRGEEESFEKIKLDFPKSTTFQKKVYKATKKIAYAQTKSYGWIAKKIRDPKAARAVGSALKVNPLPPIIPCHRVIKSDGSIGGFSCGVGMKKRLIKLEESQ